jgi:transcriptional regulator with XRE-family HTH domain
MTWHIRLTQAREAAGLSKTKLAELVGVTIAAVTQWESGQTGSLTGDNLLAICDALDVSPVWLVRGTGPVPPQLSPSGPEGETPTSLGERIKTARQAVGLSQGGLAAKLGMSQSAISQWELGTRTPEFDAVAPLAKALGVSLDWLLGTFNVPLVDIRTSLLKRSGMQVVSQLTDALANNRISEPRLRVLAALVDEFTAPA